jgi:hypothetical protein
MTEDVATQTVYVRVSTKKVLQHLAQWLPSTTHGKYTHATQDDAIRFLLERTGIDIENTREAQVAGLAQVTAAVRAEECVALLTPVNMKGLSLCARKGLTPAECKGCKIRR